MFVGKNAPAGSGARFGGRLDFSASSSSSSSSSSLMNASSMNASVLGGETFEPLSPSALAGETPVCRLLLHWSLPTGGHFIMEGGGVGVEVCWEMLFSARIIRTIFGFSSSFMADARVGIGKQDDPPYSQMGRSLSLFSSVCAEVSLNQVRISSATRGQQPQNLILKYRNNCCCRGGRGVSRRRLSPRPQCLCVACQIGGSARRRNCCPLARSAGGRSSQKTF